MKKYLVSQSYGGGIVTKRLADLIQHSDRGASIASRNIPCCLTGLQ
jgi:hypothetical protein